MSKRKDNIVPANPFNEKYSSLIRPIKIFLPAQDQNDNLEDHKYDDFVGRERLKERLFNWLSDKKKESGSYLVTGFRGMGKTILVERVVDKLTREVNEKGEPWWFLLSLVPVIIMGFSAAIKPKIMDFFSAYGYWVAIILFVWYVGVVAVFIFDKYYYKWEKKRVRKKYPNHEKFEDANVDKMARGKNDDYGSRKYSNIKISINLGHEVLRERDVLSMIATSVRDKYKAFVRSSKPHLAIKSTLVLLISMVCFAVVFSIQNIHSDKNITITNDEVTFNNTEVSIDVHNSPVLVRKEVSNDQTLVVSGNSDNSNNQQVFVNGDSSESWVSRLFAKAARAFVTTYHFETGLGGVFRFVVYILLFVLISWLLEKIFLLIPYYATPLSALRRLELLTERLNTVTGEETGLAPSANSNMFTFSLFNRKRHKTKPIADIREIETELADIINLIYSDKCVKGYQAKFIVVFDEMDKIDPAMMEQHKTTEMPEFTDSVKGFPDGMDSRERRRNVLMLLANIKLFVSTAKAKFVFISGRELYDAYLADLSDRNFAISSIFSGVLNVDSFLSPEGGQTDVRSMSEWYIANRLIPQEWLRKVEERNAKGQLKKETEESKSRAVLKKEMPSLRWYYEYLIEECDAPKAEATYVIGFLHTFAVYLTHISNGSPKKIFLYFEKYIRRNQDCEPLNEWGDVLAVGKPNVREKDDVYVLYFEQIQQKTINFVYYLANPIMGTITNDLSNYGDRFLVSLSFIIDHIYKHHNRSFSWRNIEQIPDLLKTSKAPELRDSMMSIMEYLTQTHISPILIGLNEYKFHKSIAEEISVMSKMSDEASAIFNFTLDESLSVITYNNRLLAHYMELDKPDRENNTSQRQYLPIIARIHSNLGDLHFWDEDYYAASLEYRAAIDGFSKDDTVAGFLTRIRCMLKLGLTYESRRLFPNAYQLYCQLLELLIKKRWINENDYGLYTMDQYVDDWRGKRQVIVRKGARCGSKFDAQFNHDIVSYDKEDKYVYSVDVDGVISSFASDLTQEKTATINSLTVFEEIRYVYQAILAKLSILEKMGMSGITQTNIDVAEGEFMAIHKSVNVKEKFIISADFFRKLAEILYYKNSLTILTQNQDSLYASAYYDDFDLLAYLDDFCRYDKDKPYNLYHICEPKKNVIAIKHDVKLFFDLLDNSASKNESHPKFKYDFAGDRCTYKELFEKLRDNANDYLIIIKKNGLLHPEDDFYRIKENVIGYLDYCIDRVYTNESMTFFFKGVEACGYHCRLMRKQGHRPPCYACKYYTRSLRILAENMFGDKNVLEDGFTRSYGILKKSFKSKLLYTRSNHIRILAQTLEGFGNVMFSCASGDNLEGANVRSGSGISKNIVDLIKDLLNKSTEKEELELITKREDLLSKHPISRLDKSILYYFDAYRFYLMDSCYSEAAGCLNKIINLLAYYVEVFCYYDGGEELLWSKERESKTVEAIIGDNKFHGSLLATLFRFMARYTSYKYDLTNLTEISELKWIYSKDVHDNIDLTRLSFYPAIRSAWLRVVEIRAIGTRFLEKIDSKFKHEDYLVFIRNTYSLIAPKDRYRTTFYEEVLGHYTKMRFNDHILNDILGGNPMLDSSTGEYSDNYHVRFYQKLADYLESPADLDRLDCQMFETGKDVDKRLKLVEFLILDTLVCATNMVKIFVPHNNLSSYSNSFIGINYNFYWEWSHKYEFIYSLYKYNELMQSNNKSDAEHIVSNMARRNSVIRNNPDKYSEVFRDLRFEMDRCCKMMAQIEYNEDTNKYGRRSERFYAQLRHDVDDTTISNINSNYTAEMAIKYYQMAEEANTEGTAYKEMMGTMYFLDDDMNNDTSQFNIACDRFLLNCGLVAKQRKSLEGLYKYSNVYHLRHTYITGPNNLRNEQYDPDQFDRSQFINSEY